MSGVSYARRRRRRPPRWSRCHNTAAVPSPPPFLLPYLILAHAYLIRREGGGEGGDEATHVKRRVEWEGGEGGERTEWLVNWVRNDRVLRLSHHHHYRAGAKNTAVGRRDLCTKTRTWVSCATFSGKGCQEDVALFSKLPCM